MLLIEGLVPLKLAGALAPAFREIPVLEGRAVKYLLIISDPSLRGILTAARLRDLSKELQINVEKVFLILNRVNDRLDDRLLKYIKEQKFEILGTIYTDKNIIDLELSGKPIFELPDNSVSVLQVNNIIKSLGL